MFTRKSYPNFFRIVPSENAFNAPRVKLLQAFNWTRVGTLYQNEPRFALVSVLDVVPSSTLSIVCCCCLFCPAQSILFHLVSNLSTAIDRITAVAKFHSATACSSFLYV